MRWILAVFVVVALIQLDYLCPAFPQTVVPEAATGTNVIAVVLGEKITARKKDELDGAIFGALLKRYAEENKIEPTEAELDVFIAKTAEREKQAYAKLETDRAKLQENLKSPSLSDQSKREMESQLRAIESALKSTRELQEMTKGKEEQMRPMKRQMAQQFVKSWKVNKSLYEKYGGRIIFQQAGPEPLDAYRDFLREQENKGAFQIFDKQLEASFWRYFTNDAMHTFAKKEDGDRLMDTPWWMMEEPKEK